MAALNTNSKFVSQAKINQTALLVFIRSPNFSSIQLESDVFRTLAYFKGLWYIGFCQWCNNTEYKRENAYSTCKVLAIQPNPIAPSVCCLVTVCTTRM